MVTSLRGQFCHNNQFNIFFPRITKKQTQMCACLVFPYQVYIDAET